ncbi:TMEM165/GDT1 family protein [bacterium]|nr:TMEM165/GDT1 family protein [bacterium]NIN93304.1 TMEM165/GDT1 family protein [bacterium]NIO19099.1 TMEM165/GDT1 family protein [bacterium]NIO74230.1 TMEM165/GDT1 family protein [bacterium]
MTLDIVIPLIVTGLAEFGDKTQLSIFLLSSKTKKHFHLLLGVMLAFLIVDGTAVLIGSQIIDIVPMRFLKIISGIIFIIFGVLILRAKEVKGESKLYSRNLFFSGFTLIFITEWGDKTQIAAGIFATKYNALMVLMGAMTALLLLTVMAIYLGRFVSDRADKRVVTRIAGIVFILMGISFFLF